jgi:hypothetical protein
MINDVKHAIDCIRGMVASGIFSLDDAARKFCYEQPKVTARVLDEIGNWPSSEPELLALQRVRGIGR